MKRVSFEVAKAIKESGYKQNIKATTYYSTNGYLCTDGSCNFVCNAPYALDVWLWLWREKKIAIPADYFGYENNYWSSCVPLGDRKFEFFEPLHDPEEAIISAIEYSIRKKLLK